MYADDLRILKAIGSYSYCLLLQQDIDNLNRWCFTNKLELNINKCKIVTFGRKNVRINFFYNISGNVLSRCDEIRDLGVIVDCKLSFVQHIENVAAAALKTLGFIMRNTSEFNNIFAIKLLFYALVRSKLEYCSVIWSPYQQQYIDLLENILRKFSKYLYFKMFDVYPTRHCDQSALLNVVNEVSLESRRKLASIVFLQKIICGKVVSSTLLNEISINVPRVNSRSPVPFYYSVPSTQHHFNWA